MLMTVCPKAKRTRKVRENTHHTFPGYSSSTTEEKRGAKRPCVQSFRTFLENYKRTEAGWLLLLQLDKVVKEKDELRGLNSQLQGCREDLKASKCALKEALTSSSHRAETAENQTESPPVTG